MNGTASLYPSRSRELSLHPIAPCTAQVPQEIWLGFGKKMIRKGKKRTRPAARE